MGQSDQDSVRGKSAHGAGQISSFSCRILIKDGEAFVTEPSPQMYRFFGTSPESYKDGMLKRIRKDIGDTSADALSKVLNEKASKGEDFNLVYPSMRADGSACTMRLDAYAAEPRGTGYIFDVIEMDISDLVEARKTAERLSEENRALLEDSPVAYGIYHITEDKFDLVYTNAEYYRVHCGSREFWDRFKGMDALERIVPEDRAILMDEWRKTLGKSGDHTYDAVYRCMGEDDEPHWIRLTAKLSGIVIDGQRVCYATYRNVDKERRAETFEQQYGKALLDTINSLPSISLLLGEDSDGNLTTESFSDELCHLMGYSTEEVNEEAGGDAFRTVHPDDVEMVRKTFAEHRLDPNPTDVVYRLLKKDGSFVWVSVSFIRFSVADHWHVYEVYTDIDAMKRQEQELEHQYQAAQSFLDSVSGTYHATRRINVSKDQVEEVKGVSPIKHVVEATSYSDSVGRIISMMPRQQDRIRFRQLLSNEALLEAFSSGARVVTLEYQVRQDGGNVLWLKSTVNLTKRPGSGDVIAFSAVSDITRAKIIETILNDVLVRQCDYISYLDAENNSSEVVATTIDPAAEYVVESTTDYEQVIRDYASKFLVAEERDACVEFMTIPNVLKGLEADETYSKTFTVVENEELRNKKVEFRYIDRESKLIVVMRTDFTDMQREQLRQEETLRAALLAAQQASSAKSDFLSRMSHEIRTPMNAIIGMDTLAAQSIGNDEKTADYVAKIGLSARYLLSLINDILDMSRIESGKMLLSNERFSLRDLLDGLNAMIYSQARDKGLDYECIIAHDVEEYYRGDAMKLQQVLINVLGNGVKFTDRGKVALSVSRISGTDAISNLRFIITDTGIGIKEGAIDRIFDAFEQEDSSSTSIYGGTGLGLAITKSIVGLMGGIIKVRSIVGVGSEFTIDVPLTIDESSRGPRQPIPSFEKMEALVVDDDPTICEQTCLILKEIGMTSDWVPSGKAAVRRVKELAKKPKYYDYILIDWKMPEMDGIETTRRIRKIVGPDVTIIIVSAYDWQSIEEEAKAAGVNLLVSKPLFKSTLVSAFKRAHDQEGCEPLGSGLEPEYDFMGRHLLLAEDNQLNAEIAKTLLEEKGFLVDVASNGLKAMEMYSQAPVHTYDAILMDVRMPLMDGLHAATNIRHWDKEDSETIPIIAMTANAFDEDIEKSRAAGMNAHLSKPIEPQVLFETLQRLISDD